MISFIFNEDLSNKTEQERKAIKESLDISNLKIEIFNKKISLWKVIFFIFSGLVLGFFRYVIIPNQELLPKIAKNTINAMLGRQEHAPKETAHKNTAGQTDNSAPKKQDTYNASASDISNDENMSETDEEPEYTGEVYGLTKSQLDHIKIQDDEKKKVLKVHDDIEVPTYSYIVRKYDNVESIAIKHGMLPSELLDLNPAIRGNPHLIKYGITKLKVKAWKLHKILRGHIYRKVAKMYDVSVEQILKANNFHSKRANRGDIIIIPCPTHV